MRIAGWLLLAAVAARGQDGSLEELQRLLRPSDPPPDGRYNATDRTWEDWLRRTGERPPDFAALPSIPGLPDALAGVKTRAEWPRRRAELKAQVERWLFGRMPPAPGNLRAVVTGERKEGRATVREVRLEFGPEHRAKLRVELIIPEGKGPFPVFLTNHGVNRPWIYTAVRRGYIACVYHATDPRYQNGDDSDAWVEIYPEYDWSVLARWAWAASRAVDYLVTRPEVDAARIGTTGHSRNGKSALLAAAMDERIGAVVPSSGNSGEVDPWRYTTEPFANESIELLTGAQSHWFHPRLRFFAGREDKLPVDQNTLLALVAPRGAMLYSGYAESAGNPFGFEQAYRDARRVYRWLGKEQNVWLHLRAGEHATSAGDVENFVDFFDAVFGRAVMPKQETWVHGYEYKAPQPPPPAAKLGDREQIAWVLGEEPPGVTNLQLRRAPLEASSVESWIAGVLRRPSMDATVRERIAREGMRWTEVPFGDGLKGDLFLPQAKGRYPVVVWLHGYPYQAGWSIMAPWTNGGSAWRLDQRPSIPDLVKQGFAVFAFDQIGFGARVLDARDFYRRYPRWSLMGKMVADTRAAVEALGQTAELSDVYLMGYSLGGKVALLTAALDERVKGLAVVSGFDVLRAATADKGVEGIRHYSHLHGLLPRLGPYVDKPRSSPFDFDAAVRLTAGRPVLLIAPTLDRYVRAADVAAAVKPLARPGLTVETPLDFNRFRRQTQQRVVRWLTEVRDRNAR
jgi:dienelactone hydrolase